jgi:riboflavin kinase/FMN adenylyltransferase
MTRGENAMASPAPSVLTIGSFDGVHAGHRALIARARSLADARSPRPVVTALVFDPSPGSVLRPASAPPRLSTFAQRERWLRDAGADVVQKLEPTPELLTRSAEAFVREKVRVHAPIAWVEGPDFRFGHGREGDVQTLGVLGQQFGFSTHVVEPIEVALRDHVLVPARSTIVRWLLGNRRVADAALVLTRPHELVGTVVQGDRRGRTIGFPTANIATDCLLPGDGVYAGVATLPDGLRLAAAVSVGSKPTFAGRSRALEAFLLMPERAGRAWAPLPGVAEYGWEIRLELVEFLRDQYPFPSLAALIEQIKRDCERVRASAACLLSSHAEALGTEAIAT